MKRRAAVEPVIGHLKAEHRLGRNYLKGPEGDRTNSVLAAAGYNFGLLLRWPAELLRAFIRILARHTLRPSDNPSSWILHSRPNQKARDEQLGSPSHSALPAVCIDLTTG
jgi:hypothetical protein